MKYRVARTFRSTAIAAGLVIGSAMLSHAEPQSPQGVWTAEGAGITSCADFEKAYKAAPNQTTDFFAWSEGYLTGIDQARKAEGMQPVNLGVWNEQRQAQFVNSYCTSNPNRMYGEAATALYEALSKQQGITLGK